MLENIFAKNILYLSTPRYSLSRHCGCVLMDRLCVLNAKPFISFIFPRSRTVKATPSIHSSFCLSFWRIVVLLLNMQLVSQEDRNTLVKALRKIEDKREQSLGFHKTKIVTFATCRFKTNTPRWFQLKREMSDPRLDGMMAVGIVLRLIEIDEPFCRCCYEQTEAAMYSDIRNSGFYVGTCDVKPFARWRSF